MKIGILAAGITPDELLPEHGSYAQMIIQLLNSTGSDYSFEVFDVFDNYFPKNIKHCDGWVISGSKFNAYDEEPWMLKLRQMILDIHSEKLPLAGICFGHQIIAHTLGGRVNKFKGGWGVGLHTYKVEPGFKFIKDKSKTFTINAFHQDQVLEKPKHAQVFASSKFCPYAGLAYGNLIMSVQAHPEFNNQYESDLLKLRAGTTFSNEVSERGLDTLKAPGAKPQQPLVADWFANFFNQHQ